jgi:hypothetical protein
MREETEKKSEDKKRNSGKREKDSAESSTRKTGECFSI